MRTLLTSTAAGLVATVLAYNLAVVSLVGYARTVAGMSGVGLWPAVVVHSALAAWCAACLRAARRNVGGGPNGRADRRV